MEVGPAVMEVKSEGAGEPENAGPSSKSVPKPGASPRHPSCWTVALLKIFCEQHGLKKSGKKEDLVTR